MDPPGMLMLRSIRIVFEKIGIRPESLKFNKEEFSSDDIIKALTENPKKCPTIVALDINGAFAPHMMVATNALKGKDFNRNDLLKDKWFINCKNSYRDDISEPGIVENCDYWIFCNKKRPFLVKL